MQVRYWKITLILCQTQVCYWKITSILLSHAAICHWFPMHLGTNFSVTFQFNAPREKRLFCHTQISYWLNAALNFSVTLSIQKITSPHCQTQESYQYSMHMGIKPVPCRQATNFQCILPLLQAGKLLIQYIWEKAFSFTLRLAINSMHVGNKTTFNTVRCSIWMIPAHF